MKGLYFAILLFCALAAEAQVVQYATEVVPMGVEEIERSTLWNLSGRALLRDDSRAYVMVDEGIVYECFGSSCRAYAVVGDSLFFRGYNVGRSERMNVTEGEGFSLLSQDFHQNAAYTARGRNRFGMSTSESGTVTYSVLNQGNLVIGMDTIGNVTLNRMEFNALKVTEDSVAREEIGFTVYNWTAAGSFFPLAVQYNGHNDAVLYLSPLDSEDVVVNNEEAPVDEAAVMRVLDSTSVATGSGSLTVSFGERDVNFDVDVYLLDAAGFLYGQQTVNTADEYGCVFDISGLRHGQYIVAVNLRENSELNRKILVVL